MERSVGILGIGKNVPKKVVTNAELAEQFSMTEDEIVLKTGIQTRRYEQPEITLTEMCVVAGKRAIENAGVNAEDIELVIIATNTHDYYITAALVQDQIGAKHCAGLDLHSGCSSFITGLATGVQFVKTGMYKNALVIAVDKCSALLNPNDRKTALLFADGAAAVVIGEVSKGKGILGMLMEMDGSGGKYLHLDENKNIRMDGRAVFEFATKRLPQAVLDILEKTNLALSDVDYIIPHQANLRIIEKGMEQLQFPMDKVSTRVVVNYGNSSAPAIPIALCEEVEDGVIQDGDNVLLVGYGAGLGWGAVALRWGK